MEYVSEKVAVIGGDRRQLTVAEALIAAGAVVELYGVDSMPVDNLRAAADLSQALNRARIVIFPISGVNSDGCVRGSGGESLEVRSLLTELSPNTVILTGSMQPQTVAELQQRRIHVYCYADDDRVAIRNAVPTAEGALQLALETLPITIDGSRVLVLGFGRVGAAVAGIFKALGAAVTVVARRCEVRRRAFDEGFLTSSFENIDKICAERDLIINTVPAPVLNHTALATADAGTFIIDLASSPGGVDFAAAAELNLKAVLAGGLPGKVAPKTAGVILASAIKEILDGISDEISIGGEE